MPPSPSAEELYRHGLRLLLARDVAGWVDLWAEDGVMEFPFAPEGWPTRLTGRAAVAGYMRHYPDHVELHDFPELTVHRTADPETIVAEMRGTGRLVRTGGPFEMTYIAVVTVRDGRFQHYRDYWNPLAVPLPGAGFAAAEAEPETGTGAETEVGTRAEITGADTSGAAR